ncbi:MAG: YjfB family protein [Rhodocyclaceae bacterium]|nr:YjfB family protein [Rhodocyclaceae bacterium]MDZ4214370.1 YjfB family protein [Rhodocyclaceae bacterium]
MDVSSIAAVASDMSQARTAEAVQLAVLKKAMDIEAQGAMQLVAAAASVVSAAAKNPPHLGQNINTFA